MASRRSSRRVVPAWLASPGKSSRHRPWGQMSVPTATGWPRSTSARPCSTCSSTKLPMRSRVSWSGPMSSGSRPALASASAIVVPSASSRPLARSAVMAPVITLDPAHATPKRAPSSSTKFTIPMGLRGCQPSAFDFAWSRSMAARALTTPRGPSKAPPSGTLSRWDPVTTPFWPRAAAASGSPHHAHWLPMRSSVRSRPRTEHSPANHSRRSWSSRVQAKRR